MTTKPRYIKALPICFWCGVRRNPLDYQGGYYNFGMQSGFLKFWVAKASWKIVSHPDGRPRKPDLGTFDHRSHCEPGYEMSCDSITYNTYKLVLSC